jgi:hypothetical protein
LISSQKLKRKLIMPALKAIAVGGRFAGSQSEKFHQFIGAERGGVPPCHDKTQHQ